MFLGALVLLLAMLAGGYGYRRWLLADGGDDRSAGRQVPACRCGYPLDELEVARCPECGRVTNFDATAEELQLDDEQLRQVQARRRTREMRDEPGKTAEGATAEGDAKVRTALVEILSEATNLAVVRVSGRQYPGCVVQGDSLSTLVRLAREVRGKVKSSSDEELVESARELVELLEARLDNYERVLAEHDIKLPYTK